MHKKLFVEQPSLVTRKGPIHFDNFLREKIFRNKEDAVNTFVEFIHSRTPDFYCNGIGTLAKRWKKCIESNGNYFD
ncbi:Histone-lysine N-methyltransferase SETMAR [Habropoda laboriosa]|uniref:Histone-lysine N-methyltransferase SETMAR n=1 Tax=Habropoda laboriosa TaxID=597456 RepID=A0A0L7QY47_9HYME|nr:Histone-lysine N-methyltransferase SETMAR [Habropoda laboriosa]